MQDKKKICTPAMTLLSILQYLKRSLPMTTVLQEISDKMWTLHQHLKSDGRGLSGGTIMEQTVFEILEKHVRDFRVCCHGQSDCIIMNTHLSFKKITGKSSLALNWSKNKSECQHRFDCPILLMNLKEGKWWRNKKQVDRFLPSGFYLIDDQLCNDHVQLKSNNKTNSLIDPNDLYFLMTHCLDEGLFLELPPALTDRFTYTFNEGFQEKMSSSSLSSKWPVLAFDPKQPRFIDLFCGVGGFHYALSSLNGRCVYAADVDVHCRENYRLNFGIDPDQDIRTIKESDIPPFDLLCAGFPCQPFSKAGDQVGFTDKTKGNLFFEIVRILRYHHPSLFILENVKHIVAHDHGNTWRVIRQELMDVGYQVHETPIILSPLQLGSPQLRERAFIVGRKQEHPLPSFPPPPIQSTTIKTILSTSISEEETVSPLKKKHHEAGLIWEEFCTLLQEHDVDIPRFPLWTDDWDGSFEMETKKTHYTKYKNWIDKNRTFYQKHYTFLNPWLEKARRNPQWTGCLRKLEWQCDETSLRHCLWTFRGSGIRVRNLDYSPTLVAMSMIPVYGPEWRYLTPREICRLQDFPESYHYHQKDCYKQMGNAVNVKVVRHIAEWLLRLQ